MLAKTNIETQLRHTRNRRIAEDEILAEVARIFENNQADRDAIRERLTTKNEEDHLLDPSTLKADRIFHLDDIRKMCITYRLRFLDSHFFKGDIPEEAISKIRQLENEQQRSLSNFKVMAPSKLLKLENADDPLLFAPLGNNYFYLIHKWGNDLHPLRKALMWPYKNFENLVFTVFIVSIILTALTPMNLFTKTTPTIQEYFLMFLFMFKAVGGIVLFYGFSKGKNFNTAIWNSKYYNA